MSLALLIAVIGVTDCYGAGPLQRLRRGFNSIRPGWIIPRSNEDSKSNKDDDRKSKSEESKTKTKKSQPTKADSESSKERNDATRDTSPKAAEITPLPTQPDPVKYEELTPSEDALQPQSENADLDLLKLEAPIAPAEFGAKVEATDGALRIVQVEKTGAAAAAGLREQDQIKSVGGIAVARVESFESIVHGLNNGVIVEFGLVRNRKEIKREVQFGTFREPDLTSTPETAQNRTPKLEMNRPQLKTPSRKSPILLEPTSVAVPATKPVTKQPVAPKIPRLKSVLSSSSNVTPTDSDLEAPRMLNLVPAKDSPLPNEAQSLSDLLDLSSPLTD